MKKILCFLFAVLIMVSFVACDLGGNSGSTSSDEQSGTKVDSSIKTGEVAPVGDVFELPDVKQAAGAPIIAEISKQAYPGDSVMLSGEGFKSSDIKFFVYAHIGKSFQRLLRFCSGSECPNADAVLSGKPRLRPVPRELGDAASAVSAFAVLSRFRHLSLAAGRAEHCAVREI